ncbi:hypothetical protein M9458_054398 [Cirrhinus mrigala]|uniref:Uncharacterized protein n=1 Tax=Cirrhinus mrigala TaxID=683832 RepID=A0ABD0MJF4_CIRMR
MLYSEIQGKRVRRCSVLSSCLMIQQYLRLCASAGSADVSGNIQRSVDGSVPIRAERRGRTRRPLRANSGGVVADPLASVPLDWKKRRLLLKPRRMDSLERDASFS